MSSGAQEGKGGRVTTATLAAMQEAGEPIVMVTAYDYPSAGVAEEAGVDVVLVGDSAANCVLGYDSTVPVGMDEMVMLAAAVRRGLSRPLLIGDMPFGSYEVSDEVAVSNAQRLVKEAGCDAVKLEGGGQSARRAAAISASGIPVMGHVGLTPQTAGALGGLKAQGKTADEAIRVARDAAALEAAGCFAIVIEAVPEAVAELIVGRIGIPTIGIGAGNVTDGQVLVLHDLAGINSGPTARFVRRFGDARSEILRAIGEYGRAVRSGEFPGPEHVYSVQPSELEGLRRLLDETESDSSYSWDWDPLG